MTTCWKKKMNETAGTCACGFVASSCDLIPCRSKESGVLKNDKCDCHKYSNQVCDVCQSTGSITDHPSHYNKGIEVIDFVESWGLDFRYGNVIKYTCRAPYKGHNLDDLLKAKWYLERLIREEERKHNNAAEAAGRLGDYINKINMRVPE